MDLNAFMYAATWYADGGEFLHILRTASTLPGHFRPEGTPSRKRADMPSPHPRVLTCAFPRYDHTDCDMRN